MYSLRRPGYINIEYKDKNIIAFKIDYNGNQFNPIESYGTINDIIYVENNEKELII